jgi:hypothetical protein
MVDQSRKNHGDHLQTHRNSSKADLFCSSPNAMSPLGPTTSTAIDYEITIFFLVNACQDLLGKNDNR